MSQPVEAAQQVSFWSEDIRASQEVQIMQRAERGELAYPRCGAPLYADKVIAERVYEDLLLVCLEGCGFREY